MRRIVFMSTRDHEGAFNNWTILARLVDLPARYDYALILQVFTEGFLRPAFQQANDLYAMRIERTPAGTWLRRLGPVKRLTRLGGDGWIIPEFAWDPGGRRLLWTQGRLPDRVDEPTVLRQIRAELLAELRGVDSIGEIPAGITAEVRDKVGKVLTDPCSFAPGGGSALEQQTRIGRFVTAGG
ncbi:MAG: hypothetical protein U0R52_13930 [Solirubrobacterales bacterium]